MASTEAAIRIHLYRLNSHWKALEPFRDKLTKIAMGPRITAYHPIADPLLEQLVALIKAMEEVFPELKEEEGE